MNEKEMSKEQSQEDQDKQVEMWKVKKLIKNLQAARGYVIYVEHIL